MRRADGNSSREKGERNNKGKDVVGWRYSIEEKRTSITVYGVIVRDKIWAEM